MPAEEHLVLSEEEAQAVAEVTVAFADSVPPGRDSPYRLLVEAASARRVDATQVVLLERVCAVALETGQARQLGGAEGVRLLTGVYHRTPGGAALTARSGEVNRALAQLAGRPLQSARLTCRVPGRYQLDLAVEGLALTVAIGPQGLDVRSLQTA